ncbi:Rv2231c family pyridoxal phosphate-dependent protein CobC [Nocardioides panacisoli]|uniref:Rv2231c family pyridoxal phosphate-dependent protein CobC n=1 Tax=Nocardioides panacisoli TaxID=627624 RepID=A0ABP7INQ9_9ACTN
MDDPLRHHGDVEVAGMEDFAVNVYGGPRPAWLDAALRASLDDVGAYPCSAAARGAVAARHGRPVDDVLVTAGAAEAFTLVARMRAWRRPVVVHPQFTEPHAALEQAGHAVTPVLLPEPFALDPGAVPDDADLVVVGNPTNPTGRLHPAAAIRSLTRPGRLVVVDEAFIDCVPGERESVVAVRDPGLLVIRSLTKHWGIPGVRAGYLLGGADVVAGLAHFQTPWSVATAAAAAVEACCSPAALAEAAHRAGLVAAWRDHLERGLAELGVRHLASAASFVLAQVGHGVHGRLRDAGIAVRRADTFPGLDASWVRIAVRPPDRTDRLLRALTSTETEDGVPGSRTGTP